jgi:hypothetical protein
VDSRSQCCPFSIDWHGFSLKDVSNSLTPSFRSLFLDCSDYIFVELLLFYAFALSEVDKNFYHGYDEAKTMS